MCTMDAEEKSARQNFNSLLSMAVREDVGIQYELGLCYYKGEGVPQSYTEAVKWFRRAAEQGFALAQLALGECYYNAKGVSQSDEMAAMWCRKAAEQGNGSAQFLLGLCYEAGDGVPQDCDEAIRWYQKAAEQGEHMARERMQALLA